MQIELNYPDPVPVKLEPAKTMLLIVDMENEDLHPTGKRYMGETAAQIIPTVAALRRRIKQAGGLVVHTQSVRKPDALEFTLFKNVVRKVEGSWGAEFIDDLKPEPDEPVVVKHTHDCFYRTDMEVAPGAVTIAAGRRPDHRHRHRDPRLRAMRRDGIQHSRFLRVRAPRLHDSKR